MHLTLYRLGKIQKEFKHVHPFQFLKKLIYAAQW